MSLLFGFFLLFAPLRAETGRFTIYQAGKKIGTEEFSITPRAGGYLVEGHTTISASGQKTELKSRMELNSVLKPTSYEFDSEGSSIRFKIGSATSAFEYTVKGVKQTEDLHFPDDGVIIDADCFHHYEILIYRYGSFNGTTATVPAFVPQELEMGPMTIRNDGNNTYELDTANVKIIATTDKEGKLVRLTVPDAKVVVER